MSKNTSEDRIQELELQIEALDQKVTKLQNMIGGVIPEPAKPVKPFKECSFTFEKRKFEFNLPTIGLDNGKGEFVAYSAEELSQKENAELLPKLVGMYDNGDTSFLTEVKS